MSDHTTTIHKDGRTISIVTDEDGDRTITTTADDHSDGAATVTTAVANNGDRAGTATTAHTGQPASAVVHVHHSMPAGAAFSMGMMIGALLLYIAQRLRRRRIQRAPAPIADVGQHDVAALARRTANLERIITDPATRTANEIDALR